MNEPKQWSIKLDPSEPNRGWIYPTNHRLEESCNGQVIQIGAYEQLKIENERLAKENSRIRQDVYRYEAWESETKIENAKLRAAGKGLVEALKGAGYFCQDTLARVNQAIATDCSNPECDYQCQGCLRSVDDCESTKVQIKEAIATHGKVFE